LGNFDEIWAKVIRFGQNQNLASPKDPILYNYAVIIRILSIAYMVMRNAKNQSFVHRRIMEGFALYTGIIYVTTTCRLS